MDPVVKTIIWLAVAAVLLIIIFTNIVIVPQATEHVIEFLGKYHTTWSAGLHFKIPFLQRIVKRITLKEQVLDTPPQPVITKDNVTMQIDTVVYYRIFDAKLFTYGAVDPVFALSNLTATSLRNVIGELDLDQTLTSRDTINIKLTKTLDEATDGWGIKVERVELKNIIPPVEIQNAMEKEMKAERDRRQTVLQAEGHRQAVITRAEGDKQAKILEAEGERDARIARAEGEARAIFLAKKAEADGLRALKEAGADDSVLELKKYEALVKLADGKASKIIIPTDTVQAVKRNVLFSEITGLGNVTPEGKPDPVPPVEDPCCDGELQ
ncbi:MAG: SPFH/Band 7/PHB domain protein [Lachnospiraceae bacterium]|nr:SPFH/Band 7/PHB domain protein [Lachnospiraceae bacterium]